MYRRIWSCLRFIDWTGCARKLSWCILRYHFSSFLKWQRKTARKLRKASCLLAQIRTWDLSNTKLCLCSHFICGFQRVLMGCLAINIINCYMCWNVRYTALPHWIYFVWNRSVGNVSLKFSAPNFGLEKQWPSLGEETFQLTGLSISHPLPADINGCRSARFMSAS